jgi:hypothetical protein
MLGDFGFWRLVFPMFEFGFSDGLQSPAPFALVGMGAGLAGNLQMINELNFAGFVKNAGEDPVTIYFGALELHALRSLAGRVKVFSKILCRR